MAAVDEDRRAHVRRKTGGRDQADIGSGGQVMLAGRAADQFSILQGERALGADLDRDCRLRSVRRGRKPDRRGETKPTAPDR